MATCYNRILYCTSWQWLTWAPEQFGSAAHDVKRHSIAEYHPHTRPRQLRTLATLPTWKKEVCLWHWWWINGSGWSHGGIMVKWEKWSTQRNTCPSATQCTTNPTQTGQGFNLCLCNKRLGMNWLSHGTAWQQKEKGHLWLFLHKKASFCHATRVQYTSGVLQLVLPLRGYYGP